MTAPRERSRFTAILPRENDIEASYQSWKARRPALFRQNSQTHAQKDMASPVRKVRVAVIADDQDHLIPLPNTLFDTSASLSLISRTHALATLGCMSQTPKINHRTSLDPAALITTLSITLRCRFDGGLQSFQETFHIVDDANDMRGYDAVLRTSIAVKPPAADGRSGIPGAFPILMSRPGKVGKEDRKKRDEELKRREISYQEQVKSQREMVRRQLDGGKNAVAAGGGGRH